MKNPAQRKWNLAVVITAEVVAIILIILLFYTKVIKNDDKSQKISDPSVTNVIAKTEVTTSKPPSITTPYVTTQDFPLVLDYELEKTGYMLETSIERQPIKQYTIMIYLNGSNLESYQASASDDIYEMLSSNYDMNNLNVLLFTGGTREWQNYNIPSYTNCIYLLENNGLTKLCEVGKLNMCKSSTLSRFIDFGMELFPSQRAGLIMWNHGGGAVEGYGYDEYHETDSLSLVELKDALANSSASKRKLEFIGFDACLMATIETANSVQNYAKYLVASEELEPGYGWDYSFLSEVSMADDMTGAEIGIIIIDYYTDYYTQQLFDTQTTLSIMDLGRVNGVTAMLADFADVVGDDLLDGEYRAIAKLRNKTKAFGTDADRNYNSDMIDLINLAEKMQKKYPDEANALIDSVKELVIYNGTTGNISDANGVSIYFPYANKNAVDYRLPIYREIDFEPTYKQLVVDFSEILTGETFNEYDFGEIKPTELENGEIEIFLTQDQMNNVADIYFSLWMQYEEEPDYFIELENNSNVEIDESGQILTTFNGIWKTIEGQIICMYELEKNEYYVNYSIPCMLNGKLCDMMVTYTDKDKNGNILGCYPIDEETAMPAKKMIDIKKGDKISFLYYAELFLEAEQLATDTRDAYKTFESKEFIVKKALRIKEEEVDDTIFLYGFEVYDTQYVQYLTDLIQIVF